LLSREVMATNGTTPFRLENIEPERRFGRTKLTGHRA
jgi:hypothetical protein